MIEKLPDTISTLLQKAKSLKRAEGTFKDDLYHAYFGEGVGANADGGLFWDSRQSPSLNARGYGELLGEIGGGAIAGTGGFLGGSLIGTPAVGVIASVPSGYYGARMGRGLGGNNLGTGALVLEYLLGRKPTPEELEEHKRRSLAMFGHNSNWDYLNAIPTWGKTVKPGVSALKLEQAGIWERLKKSPQRLAEAVSMLRGALRGYSRQKTLSKATAKAQIASQEALPLMAKRLDGNIEEKTQSRLLANLGDYLPENFWKVKGFSKEDFASGKYYQEVLKGFKGEPVPQDLAEGIYKLIQDHYGVRPNSKAVEVTAQHLRPSLVRYTPKDRSLAYGTGTQGYVRVGQPIVTVLDDSKDLSDAIIVFAHELLHKTQSDMVLAAMSNKQYRTSSSVLDVLNNVLNTHRKSSQQTTKSHETIEEALSAFEELRADDLLHLLRNLMWSPELSHYRDHIQRAIDKLDLKKQNRKDHYSNDIVNNFLERVIEPSTGKLDLDQLGNVAGETYYGLSHNVTPFGTKRLGSTEEHVKDVWDVIDRIKTRNDHLREMLDEFERWHGRYRKPESLSDVLKGSLIRGGVEGYESSSQ
jgi:hypothetical protein